MYISVPNNDTITIIIKIIISMQIIKLNAGPSNASIAFFYSINIFIYQIVTPIIAPITAYIEE